MQTEGVKELKNRLSEYLRRVRQGVPAIPLKRGDRRRGVAQVLDEERGTR